MKVRLVEDVDGTYAVQFAGEHGVWFVTNRTTDLAMAEYAYATLCSFHDMPVRVLKEVSK